MTNLVTSTVEMLTVLAILESTLALTRSEQQVEMCRRLGPRVVESLGRVQASLVLQETALVQLQDWHDEELMRAQRMKATAGEEVRRVENRVEGASAQVSTRRREVNERAGEVRQQEACVAKRVKELKQAEEAVEVTPWETVAEQEALLRDSRLALAGSQRRLTQSHQVVTATEQELRVARATAETAQVLFLELEGKQVALARRLEQLAEFKQQIQLLLDSAKRVHNTARDALLLEAFEAIVNLLPAALRLQEDLIGFAPNLGPGLIKAS